MEDDSPSFTVVGGSVDFKGRIAEKGVHKLS